MIVPHTAQAMEEPTTTARPKLLQGAVAGVGLFVIGYVVVDLLPVVLPSSPGLFGLRLNDVLDALFVFVLVGLYVRLGMDANLWRTPVLRVAYATALILLIQGHAVHFAANAIVEARGPTAQARDLAFFLDEHWGHTELHLAFILLAALFIAYGRSSDVEGPAPNLSRAERVVLYLATVTYGLILAADAIEGQTVLIMLPSGIGLFLWAFLPRLRFAWKPSRAAKISVYRYFFAASFGIAAVALVIYGVVMRGFPEISTL
ncbi:MAG: hypothetical protein V3U63_12085 [Gemmatimonadota bacterium]